MPKYVIGSVDDFPVGKRKVVRVKGRQIVVFNVGGELSALLNRCPHQGAELSAGQTTALIEADSPGDVRCSRPDEFIRCPWHGWEFDIRSGQSWCDPGRVAVRSYPLEVQEGAALVKGPYVAETFPISVAGAYVLLEA